MKVRIVFFALARDQVGREEMELEHSTSLTVRELRDLLMNRFPAAAVILGRSMIAVNEEYAADGQSITENATVAFIPPVSGG
ncbi:MAG: molybdopterin converting factor subunit 1 [Planctomycetota bacterium]